jgi:hypothetical protein
MSMSSSQDNEVMRSGKYYPGSLLSIEVVLLFKLGRNEVGIANRTQE